MQDCVVAPPKGGGNLAAADPFRLDPDAVGKPIRLCAEILSRQKLYEFSFAVLDGAVVEEKLVRHTKSREFLLYDRKGADFRFGKSQKNTGRIEAAAGQTPLTRLFLGVCSELGIPDYADVSDWFRESLVMVSPRRRLGGKLIFEHPEVFSALQQLLPSLDTGISRIEQRTTPFDAIPSPDGLKEYAQPLKNGLEHVVKEGDSQDLPSLFTTAGGTVMTRENGKLLLKSLAYYHRTTDGEEIELDLEQESEGTLHLINLLPVIILLTQGGVDRKLMSNVVF